MMGYSLLEASEWCCKEAKPLSSVAKSLICHIYPKKSVEPKRVLTMNKHKLCPYVLYEELNKGIIVHLDRYCEMDRSIWNTNWWPSAGEARKALWRKCGLWSWPWGTTHLHRWRIRRAVEVWTQDLGPWEWKELSWSVEAISIHSYCHPPGPVLHWYQ